MNKTGLIAKISIKYVLPICIWKYFWRISRYFAFFWEFRGSVTVRNIRSPVKKNQAVFKLFNIIVYITKQYPHPRPGSSNDGYKFNPAGLSQRNFKQGFLVYQKTCNSDKLTEYH